MMSRKNRARPARLAGLLFLLGALVPVRASGQAAPVVTLAVQDGADGARLTVSCTRALPFTMERSGATLLIHLESDRSFRIQHSPLASRFVRSVGWSRGSGATTLMIETAWPAFEFNRTVSESPFRLVIDLKPAAPAAVPTPEANVSSPSGGDESRVEPAPEPPSKTGTSEGLPVAPSVVPAVPPGVEGGSQATTRPIVVIDPGHGGLETGAKGKFGSLEKDVTLAISVKLKEVIEKNLAFRVILTRDRDTEVALESRSAAANNQKADLFLSIHTNGSLRKNAQGSETFFLSLNATDEEARRLAYLENNEGELRGQIARGSEDDVTLILWDMAQAAYIKQSSRLAEIIQAELNELLGTRNRGIKQAPFKVLTGAACPAVLVEVAFISNPEEENKLLDPAFQDTVVQAVYRGLVKFLSS
jgi:N-acetylmuramoyl-L-alanine amidase